MKDVNIIFYDLKFYSEGWQDEDEKLAVVSLPSNSQCLDVCEKQQLGSSYPVFSPSSRFLDLLLSTFIFETNCSQTYLFP